MKFLVRYSTLSTIYYVVCLLCLTTYTYLNMAGMEHGVDPISGARTIFVVCLVVCMGSLLRLYWVKGYKFYRPNATITLFIVYFLWVLIPTTMNLRDDMTLSDTITVFVCELMPICTLMITYNHMMNHGECRWLKWMFCGMFVVFTIGFFQIMLSLLSMGAVIQMVVSYLTLYMLPLVMLTNGRKINILFILLTMLVLTMSLKRGGIAAMGLGLVVYGLTYLFSARQLKRSTIIGSVLLLVVLVGVFIVVATSDEANLVERFANMETDEGSGRSAVWYTAVQLIENSDFIPLLFGHGYDQVAMNSFYGLSAHNDFLEVTYDYGLIGVILYLMAGVALFLQIVRLIRRKSPHAPIMAMFFTIYFAISMVSHIIVYPWASIVMLTVSYISAREKLDARNE